MSVTKPCFRKWQASRWPSHINDPDYDALTVDYGPAALAGDGFSDKRLIGVFDVAGDPGVLHQLMEAEAVTYGEIVLFGDEPMTGNASFIPTGWTVEGGKVKDTVILDMSDGDPVYRAFAFVDNVLGRDVFIIPNLNG